MILQDIIYGKIELRGIFEEIANCSEFQRLKDITQTGMSTLEYKELNKETRFEHSIGVYYLMSRTLNALEKKLSSEGIFISKEEKSIARLSALLHDIGHGVNSHLLEQITGDSHEQRSIDIIRDPNTEIHKIIVKYYGEEFAEKLVEFMNWIYGNKEILESIQIRPDNTVPLQQLIATLISHNIDVDRLDYLIRESTYSGLGTLTNYEELINSFECILAGNHIILATPEEKMYLIEATILERVRNYSKIYYNYSDFVGNHAFKQLLVELRKHPEEIPESVPKAIKKFFSQEKTKLTNEEYFELTNGPLSKAIEQIFHSTQNKKIRYLCKYKENAQRDYQILYNGRKESYIRKLLKKVIPEFPEDASCIFSETQTIKPYKKTKFGSTKIITKQGIQDFEELPHAVNLESIQRSVIGINTELLRLELGMSKEKFQENYGDVLQEIILNETRPTQEFELKYVPGKQCISYSKIIKFLQEKYPIQDGATYLSKDVYYDSLLDFQLLEKGDTLRTRKGITCYNEAQSREYKNKRITYKTYVEEGKTNYTNRNKKEEIGDSTDLEDYKEFLKEINLEAKLDPILEIDNFRRLFTILVNGKPIDISFNTANYYNNIYNKKGTIQTIEIRPRDNQILGRLVLLEIQQVLEDAFSELQQLTSNASIYEIGMVEAYKQHKQNKPTTKNNEDIISVKPIILAAANKVVEKIIKKREFKLAEDQER